MWITSQIIGKIIASVKGLLPQRNIFVRYAQALNYSQKSMRTSLIPVIDQIYMIQPDI